MKPGMKAFWVILGLFCYFVNTPKSFALGQTEFSLSSRSIVSGISSEALNITQWTAPISSLLALKKWQTTIITSNNKSNEASFTKASRQQSLTALSTSHVAQTRTKEFINSVSSTDKLPEDLATKYLSLYRNSSIFSGKEHSFAISSIPSVVTPEITPTTFHVSGVIQPTSSRDKMHLPTFQKEDKSLISSQEAFTKSAFFDPQMRSKRNDLQTAQLSSSNTILVQIKGHDTAVHTNNGSKLFTKGSISSINLPRTFPLSSTIWKAAELKPSPDATSFLSPDKETYSHSTQRLDTEMTTAPMKRKFSGISGISKTTSQAKLTPEDKHLSSSFILTSWGITATSVVVSPSYGPHTAHEISSVTLFVTASPTVSSISKRLSSTSTMTISTKPFVQLSVTSLISSHFSSKTETEFRALTKSYHGEVNHGSSSISPSSSFLTSDVVLKHSDPVGCNKSFSDSLCESTSFEPKEAQSSSEVSTLTETSSPSLVGKQTARSLHSKTSEHTSSSMLQFPQEKFGSSIQVTLNVVSKTSDSLKSSSMILEENLSSHYSSTVHLKAEWTVATNPEKNSALISSSSHQSVISGNTSAIGHGVRISRSFQSSVVSPKVVTPSSPIQSRTRIPHKNSSATILSSNAERLTGFSLTAAPVVPSSSPVISRLRKQNSTFTGSYYKPIPSASITGQQIRFSSSQSLVMSPELVSPSSSSMKSRLYIPHRNLSSIATSSYQKLIPSVSKNEQQVHLSSSQSTPLSTTGVLAPSSTSQSPSLVGAHKKNSSVTESYFKTVSSASLRRHPTHSSGFQNSVVSTEFVLPLYSPVMSRSKITHLRRSTFTSSSHNPPPSSSNIGHEIRLSSQSSVISEEQIAASSSLRSGSQILFDTPSRSAVTSSHQEPVASSKDRQSIHFSSQRSATVTSPITPSSSFLTSRSHILQERPSVSTGSYLSTEHQMPLPSSESSATSTKLVVPSSQSKRQSQTPYRRTSVTTGIYNKSLHSSSVIEQYVHLSSSRSPMTSMELVALSSHPKSSSQDPQKTSSARFQTPSASVSTAAATFIDKGKLQTSSSNIAVSPSRREFTSKINVPPVPGESLCTTVTSQLGTTVTPTETGTSSGTIAGNIPTEQPTTEVTESAHIKYMVMVAIVPSIVLCVFFIAVLFFRRNRRRRNKFRYSIKLEYKDENNGFRSRCVNSRLDLSLKGIHIDLELPNTPSDRGSSRDSTGYSRGPSLTETQMRELQILSQECKENLEWISEVIARDMETSICGRSQPVNRDSVYSVKEKGNYEPSAKIVRRESSKRGRESVKWRVPIVRRRDSVEFDKRDSMCTDDTTLTPDWKEEQELDRANSKNVEKIGKATQNPLVNESLKNNGDNGLKVHISNKKLELEEMQSQEMEMKERELEGNKLAVNLNPKKEAPQGKRSGKRFETL